MFVGIRSGVMAKEAVLGETVVTSNKSDIQAAAKDIAKQFGLGEVESVNPHTKNAYQHTAVVGGVTAFRILDETAPKRKIPAAIQ